MSNEELLGAFIGAAFAGRANGFRRDGVIDALNRLVRERDEARRLYIEDIVPSVEFLKAHGWPIPEDYYR